MFANRKYEELSYPQKSENVRPHTSNCIKMRPHYSQSSREIDYEQSLFFFLGPSSKTPSFLASRSFAAQRSRAWTPLAKSEEKERLLAA